MAEDRAISMGDMAWHLANEIADGLLSAAASACKAWPANTATPVISPAVFRK
jgi:hypothetical protein